jgi:UDP-glucose-4-epimerase GalE
MRILVIGGAGYIGSHAARLFRQRGNEVWVYDNLSLGHAAAAAVAIGADRFLSGDLCDAERLTGALRAHDIEAVVHYAAFAFVGESVREPEKYYQNNLVNTLTLLGCMRRAGVARIVFSSTCATYGIPQRVPITEDEPQQPINPYGRAKLGVEWALADYASAYGFGYAALRYFNAAGASPQGDLGEDHDPETHLIPLTLDVALGRRPSISIFGTDYPTPDGTCVRDYIHVDDLAEAHLLALQNLQPGAGLRLNLGIGKGYSVREVIRLCEEVTGRPIRTEEGPRRPGDPPALVAAPERAMRELGWRPRYAELRPIIETAWNWHRTHPHGYPPS